MTSARRAYDQGRAYAFAAATSGRRNFSGLYEQIAVRVGERGLDDFEFYTKEIDPETRAKWWQAAQRNPRFKSTEDPPMGFSLAAIAEKAMQCGTLIPA